MGESQAAGGMTKEELFAELKKKESLLEQWDKRYRSLVDESEDVIFTAELRGPMMEVNPAGARFFKYPSTDELLRAHMTHDLYLDPSDREKIERPLLEKGRVKNVEIPMKRKNGDPVIVRASATAIHDPQGNVVAYQAVLKDVTEQKTLEQQLLQSQKMEAMGLMTGGVAHDFNNLLTVILGNVHLGLANIERSHPNHEILTKILEEGKKGVAMTRRLLAFSHKQGVQRKPINLVEQIENLSGMLSRLIGEDIELKMEFGRGSGCVFSDEAALDQVVMNLVVNAREAMPRGGVLTVQTQNVRLEESFCHLHPFVKPGDYVKLSVTDTGIGMEEGVLQRIFEPFFTTKEGGTGLGLAVVYGLVKQNKGYVLASSEKGKGARFDVYFPAHQGFVLEENKEEPRKAVPEGRETLLMAEDESEIRRMFKTYLEGLGYHVLVAEDGEEALKTFSAHRDRIDLVILDAVMPKLSGPKVYGQMRTVRPTLPCLLLTGYSHEIVKKYVDEDMEIPVLRKPVTFEELGRKVREVLDTSAKRKGSE
jgi:two-component system, cell cycle sensor histidine kinase and response regulator CckA